MCTEWWAIAGWGVLRETVLSPIYLAAKTMKENDEQA